MAKHKIIFDTDPGIDDAMAIFMMAGHPDIDILAFTTTYGNTSVEKTTRNAQYLAHIIAPVVGKKIPVYKGVHKPMLFDNPPKYAEFVHGEDGLGNVGVPEYTPPNTHITAPEYIVKTVRQNPHEITLVAVGPLGNIAMAMHLDPEVPKLCKNLYIMGGSFYTKGNITPVAEANIYNSPHESHMVFGGSWGQGSAVAGLDITVKAPMTNTYLQDLSTANALASTLYQMSNFYMHFYTQRHAAQELYCHCHDVFAVIMMTHPEIFKTISAPVRVATDGICRGQTVPYDDNFSHITDLNRPPIKIGIGVDAVALRDIFADCIGRLG